jgi:adenine/guanine phosphoribosyltransferase-like PRPP-binding protein
MSISSPPPASTVSANDAKAGVKKNRKNNKQKRRSGEKGKLGLSEVRKKIAEIDAMTEAKKKKSAGRKLVRRVLTAIADGSVPAPAQAAKLIIPLLANKKHKNKNKSAKGEEETSVEGTKQDVEAENDE